MKQLFYFIIIFSFSLDQSFAQDKISIVIMDGQFKDVVFDIENWKQKRTNAHEISDILADFENIETNVIVTTPEWDIPQFDSVIYKIKPALIILHINAFKSSKSSSNIKGKEPFYVFFSSLNKFYKSTKKKERSIPKILLYSRAFEESADENEFFRKHFTQKYPYVYEHLAIIKIMSFKEEKERIKLIAQVKQLLNRD